ncbi:tryptophan 7-halogenase [Simiduia curdlanivorans]|uniref:Tryptophan halogenase family protein n=1 Tax=Simiduia curdlanivorans TaxID=1492769 RepID=A0ABV8UZ13_9GAMM|nr:tryptophan halogenase family protein [Simiduia curdlanivorans]MDN3640424.1 tryptophan 7-halogenase [Simiduia curdlanivorans]
MTQPHWVIVGGGTAGWIAASALTHQFNGTGIRITLIESSNISTVGVGEAVIPPFMTFIRNLGINEQEFIAKVSGTFKLGIEFRDWSKLGEHYFHPFGSLGRSLNGNDFYHCWLKASHEGDAGDLLDYSPAKIMAAQHRFFPPFKMPAQSGFETANYALHFDAGLVAKELRHYAEAKGVNRIDAQVAQVITDSTGKITELLLDNGQRVNADFFIDCTGFRGLLIDQALASPFQDWSEYLPCNSAIALQSEHTGSTPPYTTASAREAGWIWRIPLQHRMGNGYVYCDRFCDDDEAIATLQTQLIGKPLHDPRVIKFTTGMRRASWKKNCIALGLSGGFLEPLESTAIHLVTRGVQFLLELLPDLTLSDEQCESLAAEYNRRLLQDYEEIRDFLILHYCLTERDDTEFWQYCRSMQLPDSLQARIALFKARGQLPPEKDELFKKDNWLAVLHGMGIAPTSYHPFTNQLPSHQLQNALQAARQQLQTGVQSIPTHDDFIAQFCKSPLG